MTSHASGAVVLQILAHLVDIEETVTEHQYEGVFFMCNMNSSQILLHNNCMSQSKSAIYKLSHPCDIKILDISKFLTSQSQLQSIFSTLPCKSDGDCR